MAANKKIIFILAGLLLAVAAITVAVIIRNNQPNLTDDQIKEKFSCNRVTADYRPTDVYCGNPNLYREHLKDGAIIQ